MQSLQIDHNKSTMSEYDTEKQEEFLEEEAKKESLKIEREESEINPQEMDELYKQA